MFNLGQYQAFYLMYTHCENVALKILKEKGHEEEDITTYINQYKELVKEQPELMEQVYPYLKIYPEIGEAMKVSMDEGISKMGDALYQISLLIYPDYWNQELNFLEENEE